MTRFVFVRKDAEVWHTSAVFVVFAVRITRAFRQPPPIKTRSPSLVVVTVGRFACRPSAPLAHHHSAVPLTPHPEPNAGVTSHPNQIVDAINVAVSARFFAVFAPMCSFRNRAMVYVGEGL